MNALRRLLLFNVLFASTMVFAVFDSAGYSQETSETETSDEPAATFQPQFAVSINDQSELQPLSGDNEIELVTTSSFLSRTFADFEYLVWWGKGRAVPALATTDLRTTAINSGAPNFTPIALTESVSPSSQVLFGNQDIGDEEQAAGRLTFGWWLDEDATHALGVRAYGNEGNAVRTSFVSNDGGTPLGRPIFNTDPTVNAQDVQLVAHNNFGLNVAGSIAILTENDIVGTELFFRTLLASSASHRVDLVAGYQFNRIDDTLRIDTIINDNNLGNRFVSFDMFNVSNAYAAGEVGLAGEWYLGDLTVSVLGTLGVGNMRQHVKIAGQTSANGAPATQGGLLAQPTSIGPGSYQRDVLVWSPEAGIKFNYACTDNLSFSLGYTFLYWDRVALAGQQVDTNVSIAGGAFVGPDPVFRFRDTNFWVQTIDAGFSLGY